MNTIYHGGLASIVLKDRLQLRERDICGSGKRISFWNTLPRFQDFTVTLCGKSKSAVRNEVRYEMRHAVGQCLCSHPNPTTQPMVTQPIGPDSFPRPISSHAEGNGRRGVTAAAAMSLDSS
jgi:hypothetical protein